MTRRIQINPTDAVPIWKQIEDEVRRLVGSGTLSPGAGVPSVRELSRELRVNPATVVKAYQRLTDAGVLTVKRGEGTFVNGIQPTYSKPERNRLLRDAASRYAASAIAAGARLEDAVAELTTVFPKLGGKGGEQ